jgi:hypothetical protein
MEKLLQIKALIDAAVKDAEKLTRKKNRSAGVRSRNAILAASKLTIDARAELLAVLKQIQRKPRKKS